MRHLSRGRIAFISLSLFVLMGATDCNKSREEKVAVANEMVEAFGQGCGMGPWTQASLQRASQITAIYQSLLNKQGCVNNPNVQTALNSSKALEAELQKMQGTAPIGQERQWEEVSNDLLVQINQTTDPQLKSQLISQYGTARYNLSESRAQANYFFNPGYKAQMYYGFENVNTRIREILAASNSLADCYNNNPGVAMQLGSSLAELGGAFAPPMIGMGISAVSSLLRLAIDYSVKAPSARAVYDAAAVKMPAALTCGLESLTRDYCKARDARNLIDFSLKGKDEQVLPFFYGTDLQDRYMPALYGWLDKVVNGGGTIRTPEQAQLINKQFGRLAIARASLNTANGNIEEARKMILRDPTSEGDRVKALVRTLVRIFYHNNEGNFPSADDSSVFNNAEDSPSFVYKITGRTPNPSDPAQNMDQLINSLNLGAGDFTVVESGFAKLFALRFSNMMSDFNDKVQISAPMTVKAFRDRTFTGLSPKLAWERMYSFFDQYAFQQGNDGEFDKIAIKEFRERIEPVMTKLNDPNSVSEHCANPQDPSRPRGAPCIAPSTEVMSIAHEAFKLEDSTNNFLPKVVGDFVHSDLVNRACRGETPKEIKDVIKIGGQDLTALMQRAGVNSPAAMKADIASGQTITLGSLAQFRDFYLPAVKIVMRDLRTMADRNREPAPGGPNSPVRDQLSKLCILTYISGMSTADFDFSLCQDARLVSTGNVTISFRDLVRTLEGKPLDVRICSYEKFLRVDRLKNQDIPASMCTDKNPVPASPFASLRTRELRTSTATSYSADTAEKKSFWQKVLYSN